MTTRTPTADDPVGGLHPPPDLPDPASIARMANAFFAALPGAKGSPAGVDSLRPMAAEPAAFEPTLAKAGAAPAVAAHAAAPVHPPGAAGGGTSPLPAGASVGGANAVASAEPFYFLQYAGAGAPRLANSSLSTLDDLPALAARSFGLPAGADPVVAGSPLKAAGTTGPATLTPAAAGAVPTVPGTSQFYFLDPARTADPVTTLREGNRGAPFNVSAVRRDFPILSERVNGRPLVWLDNAATTQKPQSVIDRLVHFYSHENSNIHRAAHELAARSTDAYESARATVQRFLGASSAEEIVFVRGATEAINLVAQSWGRQNILPGDEIVLSHLEHHANIVPWQQLASEKGARLRVIPVDDSGQIILEEYQKLLNSRTRLVSVTQVSNALGTIVPVREVSELAHRAGATVLIDGAQAVSHMPVDVQALDADFYVFSGHKVFGPTGIGVLYGKRAILESMPPWQGGGNMISSVTFEQTRYQEPPARFEAGTGNIADAAGLAAALDYVTRIGMSVIDRYEHDLLAYATAALQTVPGLRLIGTAREKASVLSFVLEGHDPVAVGTALNQEGIAVRAGHHCAEPILRRFGVAATVRPSLAFYNTCEEIDALTSALLRLTASAGRR
jgi:cysteine desulfurase / selenocysteine lyase